MMRRMSMVMSLCFLLVALAVVAQCAEVYPPTTPWKTRVGQLLPLYGHRNWICVVDSAYPAQSREGIETIVCNDDMGDVLGAVMSQLRRQRHIMPICYMDAELPFVPEALAPGITNYRKSLPKILGDAQVESMLHNDVIAMLDQAAQTFNVLILKTNLRLPYTSVFIRLDCGYWGADAEAQMREAMEAAAIAAAPGPEE